MGVFSGDLPRCGRMTSFRLHAHQRGQAAVEAALTMPLAVFLVLGTLQLFMMLQARLMAEHAAFVAARAGALSQGRCERMLHASLLAVLPTFDRTDRPALVAEAFGARRMNRFSPARDGQRNGPILWIFRDLSNRDTVPRGRDDAGFDNPDRRPLSRLEVELVFWYPLRIPFANWVIAHMTLAAWGLGDFRAMNPLMPAVTANWTDEGPPRGVRQAVLDEFRYRTRSGQYVFPIQATAAMRMMTPAMRRRGFFQQAHCGGP